MVLTAVEKAVAVAADKQRAAPQQREEETETRIFGRNVNFEFVAIATL